MDEVNSDNSFRNIHGIIVILGVKISVMLSRVRKNPLNDPVYFGEY